MTVSSCISPPHDYTAWFHPPNHPIGKVRGLLQQLYGIDPDLIPISGERDQNFIVVQDGEQQAILKISNPDETEAYTAFQVALLEHLQESALGLPVPQVIKTRDGAPYTVWTFQNGQVSAVRLVSYLHGSPAHGTVAAWARKTGEIQGRLCRALADFDHSGAAEAMPWNASAAPLFEDSFLYGLGPDLTHLLVPHLERLKNASLPKLLTLRRQVIHNDMHPGNILLGSAGEISGIIDFGDAIKAPLIQDLAISATSLVEAAPHAAADPLQDLIDGFCSACPLTAEDLGLLHDAMIMRSILSVVLGRVKDQTVPPKDRPRAATAASETGLRAILALRLPAPQSGHSGGCANE